jgi:hypothetical protein
VLPAGRRAFSDAAVEDAARARLLVRVAPLARSIGIVAAVATDDRVDVLGVGRVARVRQIAALTGRGSRFDGPGFGSRCRRSARTVFATLYRRSVPLGYESGPPGR